MWDLRRIYKDLLDADQRRNVLTAFWRHGEPQARALATAHLARTLHFRDDTLKKMPTEKKVDLLASRLGAHDFDQFFEMALMQYLTHEQSEMLGAFLDLWNIPHVNGSIEVDEYKTPEAGQVRDAVHQLESRYDKRDIALYLAAAGLLMGSDWRDATWPVADELMSTA